MKRPVQCSQSFVCKYELMCFCMQILSFSDYCLIMCDVVIIVPLVI